MSQSTFLNTQSKTRNLARFAATPMAIACLGLMIFTTTGCTPKVEVSASDPITINLNVKIEHEIRVKVEKELEDVFNEDSGLF